MTKIHKTKLALLGATAFLTATTAQAQVADSWNITGAVEVTATNTNEDGVTLDPIDLGATTGTDGAEITNGFRNSISASAVGSSASSSFTSVNNSGIGGDATILFGTDVAPGGVTVVSGNLAPVLNNNDFATGVTIVAGEANSISLAAVGSSASVSGSTTLSDVVTTADALGGAIDGGETYSYSAGDVAVSSGSGTAKFNGTANGEKLADTGGNGASVTMTLATGVNTPAIQEGSGNSISVAGVGSSASASFSATVGGADNILDLASFTTASGTVTATNSYDGVVQVNLGAGLVTPTIGETAGGNANSISAAAVGSSASFSVASSTFGGGVITEFDAALGDVSVTSFNGENSVTLANADGDDQTAITEATIQNLGNGNSISASAVGSSGSVSYSNTVNSVGGGTSPAADTSTVAFGAIDVTSTNRGTINNYTSLDQGSIDGGSRNSISIAGVGASASQSLSVTDYTGAGATSVASSATDITLIASNVGAVSVSGGLVSASIADGFSNSISAAAVGASASQSVSRTVVGLAQ